MIYSAQLPSKTSSKRLCSLSGEHRKAPRAKLATKRLREGDREHQKRKHHHTFRFSLECIRMSMLHTGRAFHSATRLSDAIS